MIAPRLGTSLPMFREMTLITTLSQDRPIAIAICMPNDRSGKNNCASTPANRM